MKSFHQYVRENELQTLHTLTHSNATEALERLVNDHNKNIRRLIQIGLHSGEFEGDKQFKNDLREVLATIRKHHAIISNDKEDEAPIKAKQNHDLDMDNMVTPAAADRVGAAGGDGGGEGPG